VRRIATTFNRLVVDHPWLTILLFSAVTALLAAGLPKVYIEADTRKILPQDHPDMLFEDWAREFFGIEPPAVIMIVNDGPDGVFTPQTLRLVQHLSEQVEASPLVVGDDVVSLTAIDDITADEDTLLVDPFFEVAPSSRSEALRIRDAVFANPMMPGNLVSLDGKATLIMAEGLPGTPKLELYDALLEMVANAPVSDEQVVIAGRSVIEGEMGRIARSDILEMFPLVIATVGLLLALTLRCARGVVLPLMVVVTSVIWTFGLMGWTGAPVQAISSMMPSLLIAIGVADGIHIVHHFLIQLAKHPNDSARDVTFATTREMFAPVVMTSLTTAAGFYSLAISSITSMQILGTYIAFGVLAAMVFSLTLLPAVLCVLPLPRRAAARTARIEQGGHGISHRIMATFARVSSGYPQVVLAIGAVFTVVAASGVPRVVIDASLIRNFPLDNPVVSADAALQKYMVGSTPIEVVLDGHNVDTWKDPDNLEALVAMQSALEEYEHLAETRSIADFVRRMNQVMNPNDPDSYSIPPNRDLIAQYLLLYSISGEPDDFDDVVDYEYRYANLRSTVAGDSSLLVDRTVDFIQRYLDEHIAPLGIEGKVTGPAQTISMFAGLIISSQIRSLAIGLILVGLLAALLNRSFAAGFYCLIPVVVATVTNFAVLGWGGIPLGVTTALVSSMGIGIGVDYAIHFVVRYRREAAGGVEPAIAVARTMSSSGVAIFYNALVVMVGFSVLSTSGFLPNQRLGLMAALNMAVCFIATVTVLASALYYLRPAFTRVPDEDN
jgi:predicted RND superfamily exporter protein